MRIRYWKPCIRGPLLRVIARALEEKLAPLIVPGSVEVDYVPHLQVEATCRNFFGKRVRIDVEKALASP
jgi:hypothetical protein